MMVPTSSVVVTQIVSSKDDLEKDHDSSLEKDHAESLGRE